MPFGHIEQFMEVSLRITHKLGHKMIRRRNLLHLHFNLALNIFELKSIWLLKELLSVIYLFLGVDFVAALWQSMKLPWKMIQSWPIFLARSAIAQEVVLG